MAGDGSRCIAPGSSGVSAPEWSSGRQSRQPQAEAGSDKPRGGRLIGAWVEHDRRHRSAEQRAPLQEEHERITDGTDAVLEALHDGLEIRFAEAVGGSQPASARLARWTSSVAPQHQQRTRAGQMGTDTYSSPPVLCQYKHDSIVMAFPSIFGTTPARLGSTTYIYTYILIAWAASDLFARFCLQSWPAICPQREDELFRPYSAVLLSFRHVE
ncbi:hypothetical protein LI328DRAFT_161097 [Trichoderma asperelloides]|nr:hypothetical protein LI328DRAFT_161097 [Trichoderma asperelloides]